MDYRPDGLIVVKTGNREWRALVEAKIGAATLTVDQVECYRQIAKAQKLDCVITISNQFTSSPANHPLPEVNKSRSKIPVFHWSWMSVLTVCDLLISNQDVDDADQLVLLREFHRFLDHESAGVKGFDRMPPEWAELNRLVTAGGAIPAKSALAETAVEAWHQETRDLSLILSRETQAVVTQVLSRKHMADPVLRVHDDKTALCDNRRLVARFSIPDAAAPLEVVADLSRRSVDVGMTLRAPEDKVSSVARLNWLLRQIKTDRREDLIIRFHWPGTSQATQSAYPDLVANPKLINEGKENVVVTRFEVFFSRQLGARFTQQVNFISDLERLVPEFYGEVGQQLTQWRRPPPKMREPAEDQVLNEAVSKQLAE